MSKWLRENALLLSAGTLLLASVVLATVGIVEWAAHSPRYPGYIVFAVFLFGFGLYQLRRWGQQRSWDEGSKNNARRAFQAIAAVLICAGLAIETVELFEKGALSIYGWASLILLLSSLALLMVALVASRRKRR